MLKEIHPGIYQIKIAFSRSLVGRVNSYLLKNHDSWILIDTGWDAPESINALYNAFKELHLNLEKPGLVLLTHVHPDHFGMTGRIKQVSPQTRVMTHPREIELIKCRYLNFPKYCTLMTSLLKQHGMPSAAVPALEQVYVPAREFVSAVLPDKELRDGDVIAIGAYQLRVIEMPGHSPGQVGFYEAENQLLFSGDHILNMLAPSISYDVQFGGNPLQDYLNSLQNIQNLGVKKVLPGHGRVFTDLPASLRSILLHHDEEQHQIGQYLSERPHSAWEISIRMEGDPAKWDKLPAIRKRVTVTEVISHLERLASNGEIRRTLSGGFVLYEGS